MMFLDVAPDPVSTGVLAAIVLVVIGFVLLLATALVFFLWYRKRQMRFVEIDHRSVVEAAAQPSNPSQP